MKEITKNAILFGVSAIILFVIIGIGFLIGAWMQQRKEKNRIKKYADEVFNVPYEVERYLHIELEPEQVN